MTLPETIRRRVATLAGAVDGVTPVGGGCINVAHRVTVDGRPAFLKHNAAALPGFFAAEARGLDALRAAPGGPRIPHVLAWFDAADEGAPGEPSWLLLEWIEPGRRPPDFDARLGRALAAMHASADGGWGWAEDNYIGTLPQQNASASTWAEFWRDRRLHTQLRTARDSGRMPGTAAEWERLLAALPHALAAAEDDGPSLLHGDLWSGNVLCAAGGEPALVDPAAYRGHGEVDLAMADLFGGFGPAFHAAYARARPIRDGYARIRRPIYQLYYLLVHVNLFGGGYVAQTADVLRKVLREV
ncbi:MAG: Fructosamine/Ketosamine-3-kinase [Gemmatimonadetes bacterium]|nr:Fructosamine/Ketosamine-3-kinase [Gemmatimonadota bacterium]